jgi:hypothetical protein
MSSNNTPSIYIHRAHSECANPDLYRDTFNNVLGSDCVRSVDLVKKTDKNGIPFVRAFIHFKFWPRGETADRMYNELMSDKRLEITYDHETKWFWRFCRSKLPARDDPNAPPRKKNKRKPRYGDKKNMDGPSVEDNSSLSPPVLRRTSAVGGYQETSKRRGVSNQPSWMEATSGNGSHPSQGLSVSDFIPEAGETTASVSDDGEFEDYGDAN